MYLYNFSDLKKLFNNDILNNDSIINFIVKHSAPIIGILRIILIIIVISCVINIILLIAKWKVYAKANQRGWASMIPIYDNYVLFEIVEIDGWYAFFRFIPFIGKIFITVLKLIAYFKLAKYFKKDTGFSLGLIFLRFIFLPILAFDNSIYTKNE